MKNTNTHVKPESAGFFIPLSPWRKHLSVLFLTLIATWIVPPSAIAYELALADQKANVEQAERDRRTKASPHLKIAQQTETTTQLLIKTCRQIENNLIAGKPIDSELKDIEAFQKNFEEIKEKTLKQMEAQRATFADKKNMEKMLERIDARQKEIKQRFENLSTRLKSVTDNKKKPEELKKAVRELAKYLEETSQKPAVPPQDGKPKASLPRRSAPAETVASLLSSIAHNGILLASTDATIGDWLIGLDGVSASGSATPADLAATPEIIIDDEIRALALSLENHPVKIYEYVRNNFAYEPYWGSQKGSRRTLLEKAGNDIDLASLTMALLRAAGINCRYVCGTIEMPIEDAAKWIGVSDPTQIAKTFQANGIPFETTTSGGKIAKIRLNHTWIVAYVDYFPYHGTRNETPNTWIEIDPSFKQNTFTTKTDLQTTIGINPDTLLTNVKAQSELGADNLYAAKVPEAFILSEIFSYQEPIRSYLAANSLTTENVFRQRKVNEEKFGLFPVTDNYKIISRGLSFNTLPGSLSGSVTFTLKNAANTPVFTYTTPLSAIADARITLAYKPATDNDLAVITENADNNAFPVYMVNLVPELKIDDAVVGTGSAAGMGSKQILEVSFSVPGFDPALSQTPVTVGSFSALVPDYQNVTAAEIGRQQARLAALAAAPASNRDLVLGEALRGLGLSYWHQLDRFNQVTAGNLGVAITRVPSMLKVSWDLNVSDQFGLPYSASIDRIKLNIIRDYNVPVAISADKLAGEKQFAFTSALTGTALEHNVLAQPFAGEAASAARVIQQANILNKKVFTVTAANVNTIVPLLDLPAAMINDIRNAVNANIEVTVPESAVNLNGVEYYAYVKRDIDTSASEFYLDSRGGEMQNAALKASDLLLNGSAENYKNVAKPLADWLNIAADSTTNAGLAYLPAITALNSWYAKRTALDPVTTIASIIAVSGPITKVYNQPAILNVTTGDKLISPNGDGIKDSFTLSAVVTRNAAWKFQILNAQNAAIITEENTTPNININFDQNVPDGTYTYRITAVANGVNADPVSGTFRVDCTKPTVAFTAPDPATAIQHNLAIALRGTADDINFEKVTITAKGVGADPVAVYESSNITVENNLVSIDSGKFLNGQLLVTMTATDKAGNANTVTRTFTIDNPVPDLQAPIVNMTAKNNGADIVAGSNVNAESGRLDIAVTATDNVGVAKINLLLDGAVAATVSKATELAHAIGTMTLRDGAHTLLAEAYDAAGNRSASTLLNFTLTSPISNFKVSPTLAKPGTSQINVSANLREAAAWTLTFSGPGSIPAISGNSISVAGSFNPANYAEGEYTVTLTVNDKTPSLPFVINMILNQPTAKIANLTASAEGAIPVVREGLFALKGTADDADVADTVGYKVEVYDNDGEKVADVTPKPVNAQGYREGRVFDAALGELDFTMLRNNAYTLRLTVTDGQFTSSDEARFALNSELKIGQMSFSQQDLVIPVNGQPISVIRSYNSLNTSVRGDFGYGWTYSIKDIEADFNENRYNTRDDYGEIFSLREGGSRDVTITMPDGKRTTFTHSVRAEGQYFKTYKNYWTAAPGVYATLVPTCSNEIVALPGGMTYWTASGPTTDMDNFDIPGFILTLKDGTKYEIAREDLGWHEMNDYGGWEAGGNYVQAYGKASLRQITDNNGNRIVFDNSGIQSYNASNEKTKSIVFDRNAEGLISAIYAPSSLNEDGTKPEGAVPNFKYEYDTHGNLIKAHKLIDRTKPIDQQYAVTEYLYENANRPNFITSIKDALGNVPMKCIYDESGRLIATEDANGNRVALAHDLTGRSETVTDRMGNPTIHTYDDRGNVIATTDAQGNTTRRTYDSLGNELTVTDPLGNTTSYTYDGSGNKTSITDPLGNVTCFEYDGKGNQIKVVDPLGNTTQNTYDNAGNLLSTTDALGNTTRSEYDSNGNMIAMYDSNGKKTAIITYSGANISSVTDGFGTIRNFSYDSNGNQTSNYFIWTDGVISKELKSLTFYDDNSLPCRTIDSEGNELCVEYNANGKVISQTDSHGNATRTIYDVHGNAIQTQNIDGTITQTVYDANGRIVVTKSAHIPGNVADGIRTIYNALGQIIRTERLPDVMITIDYNTLESRLTSSGAPLAQTRNVYDAAGRLIQSIDADNNTIHYEYDAGGRHIASVDTFGNRTEFAYDNSGRKTSMKDALGRVIRYEYNSLGRKVKTIYPDGTYISVKYNNLGHKVETIDAAGLATKFERNENGLLIAVAKSNVFDAEYSENKIPRWEYTYNQYGQQISSKDPKGRVTEFFYDHLGRQIGRKLPMNQRESTVYNLFGQLHKQIDFKGQTVEMIYDTFGRLTHQKYYAAGSASPAEIVEFQYDELGRRKKIIEPRGTTEFTYNDRGELIQHSSPEGTLNYTYDVKTGARTRVWTANSDIRYTYDVMNRLKTVAVHKRNGVDLSSPEVTTYDYTKVGSRASVELPNGITTSYQYDNLNRLKNLTHKKAGELVASYAYDLLSTGRRSGVTEVTSSGTSRVNYTYDNLYRLTHEVRTGEQPYDIQYTYDLNSNRLQKIDGSDTINYTYNANDQLITETSGANGTTVYEYDVNGSLTTKRNTGKFNCTYEYDLRNRLFGATITRKEGLHDVTIEAQYTYNTGGIRTQALQTINGIMQNRYFLLDSGLTGYSQVFEESSSLGGNPIRSYVLGDDALSQNVSGNTNHFLYDGHGSTRLLADAAGTIGETYNYDAYGKKLGGDSNVNNLAQTDLLYAGEQFDPGLQMQYLRARYYDTNTGRFNRLDPFTGNNDDPQSLHKYAYCHADSVNNIDPSGLMSLGEISLMGQLSNALRGFFTINLVALKSSMTVKIMGALLAVLILQMVVCDNSTVAICATKGSHTKIQSYSLDDPEHLPFLLNLYDYQGWEIRNLTIVGHGAIDRAELIKDPYTAMYADMDKSSIFIKNEQNRSEYNITKLLDDAMHPEGRIQLESCDTAYPWGDSELNVKPGDNLARRMSYILKDRTISGGKFKMVNVRPFMDTALGFRLYYKNGKQAISPLFL